MVRKLIILSVFILTGCIASPRALQSDNIILETAALIANQEGVQYLLVAQFEESIPDNTQAVIIYQNLTDPETAVELALGSMTDARSITFKSKPVKIVTQQPAYGIELLLYANDSKGRLIARRQIVLPLELSERVAGLMGITLL